MSKLELILNRLNVTVDEPTMKELELIMAGKKKGLVIPTLKDFNEYFEFKGYSLVLAEKSYNYYNEHGWKDSKGSPVVNWKQKVSANWFKDEYKVKKKEVVEVPILIHLIKPEYTGVQKMKCKLINREKVNVESLPDEQRGWYDEAKIWYDSFIDSLVQKVCLKTPLSDYEKRVLQNYEKFPL